MAESAIPNAGLGMYTVAPIAKGDPVYFPDIMINYIDYKANEELGDLLRNRDDSSIKEHVVGDKEDSNRDCS